MAGGPSVPAQVLYSNVGIYNGPIPKEGPKCVPIGLDFSAQNTYNIDFTMLQQRGFLSEIQAVFIDNFSNAQPVTLTVNGTNQRVVCPPLSQGIFPLFCPNPPRFVAQTTGMVAVGMQFLNVPITCLTWNAAGAPFTFSGSGALNVSDAALDATISNGAVATQPKSQGSTDALVPTFVGDDLFTGTFSDAGAHTIIAGNTRWFFTMAQILLSPDAAATTGATEITILLKDTGAGTTIAESIVTVPVAAPTLTDASAPLVALNLQNLSYNAKAAGNLTVTASVALTTGNFIFNVAGGTTNVIGP